MNLSETKSRFRQEVPEPPLHVHPQGPDFGAAVHIVVVLVGGRGLVRMAGDRDAAEVAAPRGNRSFVECLEHLEDRWRIPHGGELRRREHHTLQGNEVRVVAGDWVETGPGVLAPESLYQDQLRRRLQ